MGIFSNPKCTACTRERAFCICASNPGKAIKRQDPKVRKPRGKK